MLKAKVSELSKLQDSKKWHHNNNHNVLENQRIIIKELLHEENIANSIVQHYLQDYQTLDKKEYTLTYEEFLQLEKERDVIDGVKNLFAKEIAELKKEIENLSKYFDLEEMLTNNDTKSKALDNLYVIEQKCIDKIMNIITKIISQESEFDKYLKILRDLPYDKKMLRKSKSVSKIIIKSPVLPLLSLNIFHKEAPKFYIITEGLNNIPKSGPCIIAPHHHHASLDPIIMKAIIDRNIFFIASTETFTVSKKYGKMLTNIGTLPYTRDDDGRTRITPEKIRQKAIAYNTDNTDSIFKALKHLQIGDIIGVFPEDDAKVFFPTYARPKDQEFIEPKEGFVYLSAIMKKRYNINVPIIPIGIKYSGIKIHVIVGQPISLTSDVKGMNTKQFKQYITDQTKIIFDEIKRLST